MNIEIKEYTKQRINDVIRFEKDLRNEENILGWEIDDAYLTQVTAGFDDPSIDSAMIKSRFDGSVKAYLDWICVLKSYRHRGIAQALLNVLRSQLKEKNVNTLITLTASNEETQRFYQNIPDSIMRDTVDLD